MPRVGVMSDKLLLAAPPDPPPEEGREDDQRKKKKIEVQLPEISDAHMKEKEVGAVVEDNIADKTPSQEVHMTQEEISQPAQKFPSYRASLMGFNGVANNRYSMAEDEEFLHEDGKSRPAFLTIQSLAEHGLTIDCRISPQSEAR